MIMRLITVIAAGLLLTGCTSAPEYSIAPDESLRNATVPKPAARDEYFADIAVSEVPGFAGFYIDGSTVVMNYSGPFDQGKAGAFLLAHAAEWGIDPKAAVTFRPVRYSY